MYITKKLNLFNHRTGVVLKPHQELIINTIDGFEKIGWKVATFLVILLQIVIIAVILFGSVGGTMYLFKNI